MSTYKRISGDYNITTLNAADNVSITTNTVLINGNLEVGGNLTYINVEELDIRDPFIMLNSSNTATYAANSGILTHKTASDYAGLRWNNAASQWETTSSTSAAGDTGTWTAIGSGSGGLPGGANTQIQFNDAGVFGGSGNLTFDKVTGALTIQGYEVLGNIGTTPAPIANTVIMYNNTQGTGGTGVFVRSGTVNDELVSKSKAIIFGLIF